jgi:ribosomal protein L14
MIPPYLTVADNTEQKIMCIRVLGNNRKYGHYC